MTRHSGDPHAAACCRVLAQHLRLPRISVDQTRMWIRRLAVVPTGPAEQRLITELEEVSGLPIAELAKLTEKWLAT